MPLVYSIQTIGSGANATRYLIKWTTDDVHPNFDDRIIYNVSYPLRGITGIYDVPNKAGAVDGVGVLPGDNSVGFYFGNTGTGSPAIATTNPSGAFNCSTGQMLWTTTYPYDYAQYTLSSMIADPGVFLHASYVADPNPGMNGARPLSGIDIFTGKILFNETVTPWPWSPFWPYSQAAAYGLAYYPMYDGHVYAFETTTGKQVWTGGYNYVGYQTPYGWQPFFSAILVGGGIVFAGNDEHSEGPPYYQGKQLWALNATTGETIWTIPFWSPGFNTNQMILSDGKIIATNYYDGNIYCFDKGPSATMVTAPNIGVTTATPITITGTVLDISAGQPQNAVRFPHGLPCVSDGSMKDFMAYAYMQKAQPTNTTGVPVSIYVLDSNNNYRSIGTTTSDDSGTFAYTWTPDIPGQYKLIASFGGSESYFGSYAETYFFAAEAPSATPQPTQAPASLADQYFLPMSIGTIIAIVVVIILVLLLLLRKR